MTRQRSVLTVIAGTFVVVACLVDAPTIHAQVTEGTMEFLTPNLVEFDVATSSGTCSPAELDSIWSTPNGGALKPIRAGDGFDAVYLYYCHGIPIRISLSASTDASRRVGHQLFPRYIWIRTAVEFIRDGDTYHVGEDEVVVDTEAWGDTNRVDLGPRNDRLVNFPGVAIVNIRGLWLQWNTPWR